MGLNWKWAAGIGAAVIAISAFIVLRSTTHAIGGAAAPAGSDYREPQVRASAAIRNPQMIAPYVPKVPPHARSKSTFAVSAPASEPDRVVAEVKPAAVAGDVTAMRILGQTLERCAHADMRSDRELEAAAAKFSMDMEFMQKTNGVASVMHGEADSAKAGAKMAAEMKQLRDSCSQVPNADLDSRQEWLRKAAAGGDSQARLSIASDLIKQAKDQSLLIEERERLTAEWTDLLQANITDGACTNMELNLFWQNSRDPILTYIYAGILMRRGLAAIDSLPPEKREQERESLNRNLNVYAAAVPQDQLAAAEATRRYIEANYCSM